MNVGQLVIGPPCCEDHLAHVLGCIGCAGAVCIANDLDVDKAVDELIQIGWDRPDGW